MIGRYACAHEQDSDQRRISGAPIGSPVKENGPVDIATGPGRPYINAVLFGFS